MTYKYMHERTKCVMKKKLNIYEIIFYLINLFYCFMFFSLFLIFIARIFTEDKKYIPGSIISSIFGLFFLLIIIFLMKTKNIYVSIVINLFFMLVVLNSLSNLQDSMYSLVMLLVSVSTTFLIHKIEKTNKINENKEAA